MNISPKTAAFGLVIVLLLVGGYFVLSKGPAANTTGPITIGASLPLTGDAASYGEMARAGIELAVKEINDAGGINGRTLSVTYEDDLCSATGGVNAFNKLITIDHVAAIIGPVCSPAAVPALPLAQQHHVPTIIIASAAGLPAIGDYIFRNYPSDSLQGRFAAEYVFNTLGKKKVAVLYTNDDWGSGLRDTFTQRFTELGGTITESEGADVSATDLRTPLTKIKASNPELVYIPLHASGGVAAAKQAKLLGLTVPLMGGDYFDAKEFTSVPETAGVLFTIGKINNPDDFKARVKAATGADSGLLTPLGYDATEMLTNAIKVGGNDPVQVQKALSATVYTKGVSFPSISFDSTGDLQSAQFEVRIVKNGESQSYAQ